MCCSTSSCLSVQDERSVCWFLLSSYCSLHFLMNQDIAHQHWDQQPAFKFVMHRGGRNPKCQYVIRSGDVNVDWSSFNRQVLLLCTPPGRLMGTAVGGERRGQAGRLVFFYTSSWFAHIRPRKWKPLLIETPINIAYFSWNGYYMYWTY